MSRAMGLPPRLGPVTLRACRAPVGSHVLPSLGQRHVMIQRHAGARSAVGTHRRSIPPEFAPVRVVVAAVTTFSEGQAGPPTPCWARRVYRAGAQVGAPPYKAGALCWGGHQRGAFRGRRARAISTSSSGPSHTSREAFPMWDRRRARLTAVTAPARAGAPGTPVGEGVPGSC